MGGLNLYAYAPNPTGWVDPLGLVDINLFPQSEKVYGYAEKVPANPGVFQVGAHGNPVLIVDANKRQVSAANLAKQIKAHPKYREGMTVELLSCNTGSGDNPYAQKLANELGTKVRAPTQYVWYSSNGEISVRDWDESHKKMPWWNPFGWGRMKTFDPEKD